MTPRRSGTLDAKETYVAEDPKDTIITPDGRVVERYPRRERAQTL